MIRPAENLRPFTLVTKLEKIIKDLPARITVIQNYITKLKVSI